MENLMNFEYNYGLDNYRVHRNESSAILWQFTQSSEIR